MRYYVVTGAAGFIGSRIVAALNRHGVSEVIAVDNLAQADKFRNLGNDGKTMHFPGFHIEAAQQLMELPSVKAIAVDTLSLDFGQSPDFIVHNTWLPSGRYGIEGIANLDKVPAVGATIVVGAPKVRGGTGGPARVLALV